MCKRTIAMLMDLPGRVYIYMEDDETAGRFFADAEAEGFVFGDGEKPSNKHKDRIIAVNKDRTLNYVGSAGHAAFGSGTKTMGDCSLIRVDYKRYAAGDPEYMIEG